MTDRRLDVICIGRSSVDLYGEQVGCRLEDTSSFAKYVGGCATNIAVGTARLGLRSALITAVGDEQMGRFIVETLIAEGVDTSQIKRDAERLTALVILGIRDRKSFPHIFYRENCADMALTADDIDAGFIAAAQTLLVTGTHFSTPGVDAMSRAAIRHAKAAGTRVVLDIDYRPVLWGLGGHADGEGRFIADDSVSAHLQSILGDCDLIVGTEEEIHIAGGVSDTLAAVQAIRAVSAAAIVVKRGPLGCVVFPEAIPDDIEDGIVARGNAVEVFNTLGAGDGFMSGFLSGWVRGEDWRRCCALANGAGALVVSRHGCAPAMPNWAELTHYLDQGSDHFRLREDAALNRLHRIAGRKRQWPEVCALAFDHRAQFEEIADRHGAGRESISRFKDLVGAAARQALNGRQAGGVIVDAVYGADPLAELSDGAWWIARPVEKPGSLPLEFEAGNEIGLHLRSWPEAQIAKCLVYYHPDDPEALRRRQESKLGDLYQACVATERDLLVEIIPPAARPLDHTTLARAMDNIYRAGVFPDWWKLPPPADDAAWAAISASIEGHDAHCRGVILLGLSAPVAEIKKGFEVAAGQPLCKGFAIGRSVFQEAAEAWFAADLDDDGVIAEVSGRYSELLEAWSGRRPA